MSVFNFPIVPVDLFNEPAFRLGAFHARPAVREIEMDQQVERLEPRVFQVLVVLARSRNRTISRDALIAQCWNGRFVSDDALNRTIGKLRRVFARDPSGSVIIETVPGIGYQMRVPDAAARGQGRLYDGDDFHTGGLDRCRCGAPDGLHDPAANRFPDGESDHRIVVSETLREAGRILDQALNAIGIPGARGGAQLKLTIELTMLDRGVLQGASDDPFTGLNGRTAGLAGYKERNHR